MKMRVHTNVSQKHRFIFKKGSVISYNSWKLYLYANLTYTGGEDAFCGGLFSLVNKCTFGDLLHIHSNRAMYVVSTQNKLKMSMFIVMKKHVIQGKGVAH